MHQKVEKTDRDWTLAVIPFGYPYYPPEIVEAQVEQSKKLLQRLSPVFFNTVFGREEMKKAAEHLHSENPDLVVALLVSWIEAPNLIDTLKEYFGKPLVLWSHTTVRLDGKKQTLGAFVAAGVIKQTLQDLGVPFQFVYGKPSEESVLVSVEKAYRAARTVKRLNDTRIGLMGYPALGMYTGTIDHIDMKKVFGPEIVHLDEYQLVHRVENLTDEEVADTDAEIKGNIALAEDVRDEDITLSSKMYVSLKGIIEENELDAVTVKCQYELSQIYKYTPCVALSLLGDQLPSSCEGDLLTILTQVMLHYLTGNTVTYCDIHEVLEDRILVAACGFAPFSMSEKESCRICKWGWEAFNGVLNVSSLRKGEVTLARVARDGEGYKVHVATGYSDGKSEWNEVGCPPFPGTDVLLDGKTDEFAKELVSNHYAMVFGNSSQDIEALCKLLNIRYIYT